MPVETIGENSDDDYAGIIDTYLHQFGGDNSSATNLESFNGGGGIGSCPLIRCSIPVAMQGATINSAKLVTYKDGGDSGNNTVNVRLRRVLRNWIASEARWSVYSSGNNWTTAGCQGDGTDRGSSNDSTLAVNLNAGGDGTLWEFTNITSLFQAWADGSVDPYGVQLYVDDAGGTQFGTFLIFSSEGTDGFRPRFEVDYTPAGSGQYVAWIRA